MIITNKQKEELKSILTEKEFEKLIALSTDISDFEDELDHLIVTRLDKELNPTEDYRKLQVLYEEIYKQN